MRCRRLARIVLVLAVFLLVPALRPTLAAQPTEADVDVADGLLALDSKEYELALTHLRRALEKNPNHLEALYLSGLAYLALDRPADAEHVLERAFARNPELDSLGYYVGFLRYQQRQYQAALRAFRAGRTNDPNIAQLTRVYTGLTLAALGRPGLGAEEIDRAVRQQPASPLTGPAEQLRASLAGRETDRRLRASARLSLFYDDNARAAPDPAASVVVRDLRSADRRTVGELLSLGVEYDFWRHDEWTATAGYSFLRTYNNSIPDFNVIDHLGTLAVGRRDMVRDMPLDSALNYSFEHVSLGGDRLLVRNSVSATGTLVETPRHLTNGIARLDLKDYTQPSQVRPPENQDATNLMFGVLHVMRFDHDRHLLKAGYQYDVEDADGRDFTYHGHRLLAGGLYTLPWRDVRLSYDLGFHYRDYAHRNSLFPETSPGTRERNDKELTQLFRVAVPVVRDLTWGALEMLLDYHRTDAASNLAVYDYTRNVVTVSVTWRY